MKKIFISTILTISFLWSIALGIISGMEFNNQVTNSISTGIGEVNFTLFFLSLLFLLVSVIGLLVYFIKRWNQEKIKRNISFFKFIFTEINVSEEDEREIEICRKASLTSSKIMDNCIFISIILLQYFKVYTISLKLLILGVVLIITIRELSYLLKWYKYYKVK